MCTGLYDDTRETPDDYRDLLTDALGRKLPMICANPDLKVQRGGDMVWCAGGVAAVYEELGGDVAYAGKPHAPIYTLALAQLSRLRDDEVTPDRILAIGDGVKTDIAGAAGAGIRSIFIASGVHVAGDLDEQTLGQLFADTPGRPVAAMTGLVW